jgi:hypothetical protein
MFARIPSGRLACLSVASTLTLAALSAGSAQEASRIDPASSIALAGATAVGQVNAPPALNPRHPDTYVVQRGDTLWDIAAMFLQDPWYWPEIWQINPQIENPHLIYPGDILSLSFIDGRPAISLERGSGVVERLSPRIRTSPLEEAIPTIPYETLRAFLSRPSVLERQQFETLPYIVATPDGLMGSAGEEVYVRGTNAELGSAFNVVHVGRPLVDPDDNEVLGYEGIYVGRGSVRRAGDPSSLSLRETNREALVGDYLLPEETVENPTFIPRAPDSQIDGRIISVIDGVDLIGQYQVVVINRGAQHGLEPGHVLTVLKTGGVIRDKTKKGFGGEKVQLPNEPAGTMMVFRTFDRMSYALIMEATQAIAVLDTVQNPT